MLKKYLFLLHSLAAIIGCVVAQRSIPTIEEQTLEGFEASLWPNGQISYEISSSFDAATRQTIEQVLTTINDKHVCVKFSPRSRMETTYLEFAKNDISCLSQAIGHIGSLQSIFLTPNCSTERFIYWVVLQALGLPAEHMRPDRDNYIIVNWQNIIPNYWPAFKKYKSIDRRILTVPYDIHSRLHYPGDKFVTNPILKSIESRSNPLAILGNRDGPTEYDYQKIRALYCNGLPMNMFQGIAPAASTTPEMVRNTTRHEEPVQVLLIKFQLFKSMLFLC